MIDWFRGISEHYGVDPLVFAIIYITTIPGFTMSVGWIVRRILLGRSFVLPAVSAAVFYLSSYIYIFAVGRNIPLWFYLVLVAIICTGSFFTIQNIRKRAARIRPQDTTHDLIVIGGGAAGLTAAGIASNLGAKTLLVERDRLGGDCTWGGCIPSKTLLKSARMARELRQSARFGVSAAGAEVDFQQVMEHVRTVREDVYHEADRPEIYREMGVEVRFGQACFLDAHNIEIEDEDGGITTASGRYVIIATGARPRLPDVPGLDKVPYYTSETIFQLEEQPARLAILGGGAVGVELAQAFQRLGTEVTVVERAPRILENEGVELVQQLQERLEGEGVRFLCRADVHGVREREGTIYLDVATPEASQTLEADALLVATGRQPNVDDLRLEAAGVEHTAQGIQVSERCRTNQRPVFAIGDVTGRYFFTHMSRHMAKVAVTNALLKFPQKMDTVHVPRVIYTDPEVAHVGLTEEELEAQDARYEVYRFPYEKLDRAVTDGETTGWVKIYATKWRGRILGATILGDRAGDLIGEVTLAMRQGITLRQLSDTIHPYPTYGMGVRRAADQWYVRKQTPRLVHFIKRVFGYRGPVHEHDPNRIV